MAWVRARLCKLQKGCTRLAATNDKAYQLLAHGRLFSPSTPASSSTKAGRHDIAEILLKVALKNQKSNQINSTCLSLLLLVQHLLLCSWVLYISPLIALLLSTSAQHILLCCSALTQHVLHCCSVLAQYVYLCC